VNLGASRVAESPSPSVAPRPQSAPLRILTVVDGYYPSTGGAELQAGLISRALVNAGHRVTILAPRLEVHRPLHEEIDGIAVERIAYPRVRMLGALVLGLKFAWRLYARRHEYDAIHIHMAKNLATVAGHAVAVSRSRARSWGVTHLVLPNSADPDAYLPYVGDVACGLRVVDEATVKRGEHAWAFHERAMDGLPLRIVGHAPDLRGVAAADDWHHLKRMLASHRFVVHTTDPRYEDGYDLAVLEAMAAGVPVLTNRNATTIVQHGVTGFVSETPDEMRAHAHKLLADEGLAREIGANARAYVARHHSPERFRAEFPMAVQEARKKWSR